MSGKLRELKNRIRSVENTKKITRAMEMVAAAKLRRFQDLMVKTRPYTDGLENLLKRLHQDLPEKSHPFFEEREEKRRAYVVFTSDTGLCGSYNNDLVSMAHRQIRENNDSNILIGVGKSGITALKRTGRKFEAEFTDLRISRVEEVLAELKHKIETLFMSGEADAIYCVYSHFLTVTSYKPITEKLLPLQKPEKHADDRQNPVEYIFEPNPGVIFEKLIPVYFEAKTRLIFLESFVSEQIARMTAMHQATDNAREMIDSLVLERNKARQASITKEIIEIVSGSQALKIK